MLPVPLTDKTRSLSPPSNWDAETSGECLTLEIADREHDGSNWMYSAWSLEPGELQALADGSPLFLRIASTQHPVVSLFVQDPPAPKSPAALAADIGRTIALAIQARIEIAAQVHPDRMILVSPPRVGPTGVGVEFVVASPLEIIPPEFAQWIKVGPFTVADPQS